MIEWWYGGREWKSQCWRMKENEGMIWEMEEEVFVKKSSNGNEEENG